MMCAIAPLGAAPAVSKNFMVRPQPSKATSQTHSQNACSVHIAAAEQRHKMPANLMQAVAKVESGKATKTSGVVAWPWTVNAEGKGFFYKSKAEAIRAVKEMQAQGIESIDVGCMQVNLRHHPDAFRSLDAAFDPAENVKYAADFLSRLNHQHGTWHKAVAHYHSATPLHHIPYQRKVMAVWNKEKGGIDKNVRLAVVKDIRPIGSRAIIRRVAGRKAPPPALTKNLHASVDALKEGMGVIRRAGPPYRVKVRALTGPRIKRVVRS